ncbi:class I SAM-dependent methyltransferase [Allorhodopirellula heiligendammensis]|uniref:Ubiquinone/menaquinone biosynthesis methyltransferase n=1 Tax=Allorhodopirellula heiligendammensis TaxID=2714739 RepID=A0A5C6BXU2_9BACT|nr:class I SAM-dependent methyltransferase [Allorhodopirellula heiligendammensis]TWU16291.1 ubiquinone/menaquinone biosynthesis methyltransferase [Allorhodopirellula heiligendammensis]
MSNQDRTLDHYQELMTINATSHLLRTARTVGLFDQLATGQQTLPALAENLGIPADRLLLLLQSLISVGIIEQYQEDYALSATARLLCQYDADLGDATWEKLANALRESPLDEPEKETRSAEFAARLRTRADAVAATQWVHTPAAMQAAEILGFGPSEETPDASSESNDSVAPAASQAVAGPVATEPIELLDLGCGSAVWSCAMAFREPAIHVTAIDSEAALVAAQSMADSIELNDRFEAKVGDVLDASLPADSYDMILIAQRLHAYSMEQVEQILKSCLASLKSGGRIVVIDLFRGPHRPTLSESLEALRLQVQTGEGAVPELKSAEQRFRDAGYESVQFTYIAASRVGLGMMIGSKP